MTAIGQILQGVLWSFIGLMWIRFVFDWVQVVYSITDPPIKAVRRAIPPLRLGNFMLDLGFLIVMIAAYVLLAINSAVFF
jgi:YggT family protein